MIILGIETSCDETATAVVKDGTNVLSSSVASSENIHQKHGGIIPEYAAREQIKCIIPVIQTALKQSGILGYKDTPILRKNKKSQNILISKYPNIIDAIAVTHGPGLIGSLLVGLETAKTLSFVWNKPIVPVNHLIAHIYANLIHQPPATSHQSPVQFPALCLIVSGGHTELVLMKSHKKFIWIGGTRDDAAGECFDKCARLLGFGYPGGPEIEAAASSIRHPATSNQFSFKLPRPMINDHSFDFSFSGLKTAVLNLIKNNQQLAIINKQLISYEIQEAITDVLVKKTIKAAKKLKVKSILIGGGVAANQRLREKLKLGIRNKGLGIRLCLPEKKWCTDNAATIASTAYFNFKPTPWQKIKPNPSLQILRNKSKLDEI